MESWKKLLVAAAGVIGVTAVVYFLLADEPEKPALGSGEEDQRRRRVEDITKEEVQKILDEIVESQEKMKVHMKALTKELLQHKLSFEETYNRISKVEPEDPLEKYGLSMMDFDQLLSRHQHDPQIHDGIRKIMGVPMMQQQMEKARTPPVDVAKVVEVHRYMLEELKERVAAFSKLPRPDKYDRKTVTLAVQALVGANVEEKYGLTSEDIEIAVMQHHQELASDKHFAEVNIEMQHAMTQLMSPSMH